MQQSHSELIVHIALHSIWLLLKLDLKHTLSVKLWSNLPWPTKCRNIEAVTSAKHSKWEGYCIDLR